MVNEPVSGAAPQQHALHSLSEVATLMKQAHHIVGQMHANLWRNPALTAVLLNDLSAMHSTVMHYTIEVERLLAVPASQEQRPARPSE
jgi:hypothetical protein